MSVDVDVLIVGAGLSGIGAAHRLATESPQRTFAIVERRNSIGGTWDLFRYPGVRSDSDMYTLSFPFKPWTNPKAIADGADIRDYLIEAAQEFGIADRISYGKHVTDASWNSEDATWAVTMTTSEGSIETLRTNFLYLCSGYYSYDEGYLPEFPGYSDFKGETIHPQFWPEHADYKGKNVVIVGSGATAITLLPAMAEQAKSVTMLQRTPTYMLSQPTFDPIARLGRFIMPAQWAHRLSRLRYAIMTVGFYMFCRAFPKTARTVLLGMAKQASPDSLDPKHLTPPYMPWDQRLCVVPKKDLFNALKSGKANIVTDTIKTFTPTGVETASGEHLDADIIVTATGLKLVAFGNINLSVDGEKVNTSEVLAYKGTMFSGLPNLAWCIGYTNASWTLRANLTWSYVTQFLNTLDQRGYAYGVPTPSATRMKTASSFDLDSGYIQRAADVLPQAGTKRPWTVRQNWFLDTWDAKTHDVDEDIRWVRLSDLHVDALAEPAR